MLWEELRTKQFKAWIEKSEGVCVLPLGVLEKHGDHLPLGTDMYTAQAISKKAAEISPAVVFPYYFLGQISEARHYAGTIAVSHRLMMDALLEMCDEIGRNGFTKIIIVNSHGGNNAFLQFFAQEMPRLHRKYAVYTCTATRLTRAQLDEIHKISGVQEMGAHAGFKETALLLHLHPDLVDLDDQQPQEGEPLGRLRPLVDADVFSGFNWYADYPNHFAGDHTQATAELGSVIFEMVCANVAEIIQKVKDDPMLMTLGKEFADLTENPQ